jgi:CheY-like chemotaxis protein
MELRVLVIDDDEVSRDVLAVLLEGTGYAVQTLDSGEAALAFLRTVRPLPEVVLADRQMPGVAGEELARKMRNVCGTETMLLAMSGTKSETEEHGGFDGFLLKPFSMEEFAAAVIGGAAAVADRPDAVEVLDEHVYAKLAGSMRGERLEELYGMCLADAERRVENMKMAAAAKDESTYCIQAHAIKGSCGMVGARELQGLANAMESRGLWDDHVASLDRFLLACERLRGMLIARGIRDSRKTEVSREEAQ